MSNVVDPNAALTSVFGSSLGPTQNQVWSIAQSTFRGVPFHIFKKSSSLPDGSTVKYDAGVSRVHDRAGRRKVMYQFPFQDGQTTGDLGRTPFDFEFDILFFGPNYYSGYQAFSNALNQPTPAILTHPVLGDINCVAVDWENTHESSERFAITMHVVFKEHTYDPALPFQNVPALSNPISTGKPSTFKSAVIAALSAFQAVDAVQTAITANTSYIAGFKNGTINLVTTYKASFLLTLQSIYLTFAPDSVSLAPDLPGLLPVALGGQVTTSGTTASSLYPLTNSSVTPFSEVSTPANQNPVSVTPIQAEALVNGVLAQLQILVTSLNGGNNGSGAFDFYDQILALKQGGVQMRAALLQGLASSNNITTQYTVPLEIPVMSVREVAFAIGLDVNLCDQITQLNPQLLSVNYIPGGTVLQIPVVS